MKLTLICPNQLIWSNLTWETIKNKLEIKKIIISCSIAPLEHEKEQKQTSKTS